MEKLDPKKERIKELRSELKALNEIKNSGVLTVSYRGQTTTFRSMNDLRKAISDLNKELEFLLEGGRKIIDYSGFRND